MTLLDAPDLSAAAPLRPSSTAEVSLTTSLIHQSIEAVCDRANAEQDCWVFRRASETDLTHARRAGDSVDETLGSSQRQEPVHLVYGLVATPAASEGAASSQYVPSLATFYLAYSTWDGRVLYLDLMGPLSPNFEPSAVATTTLPEPVMWLHLARVAVLLNCSRFTWQQWGGSNVAVDDPDPSESSASQVVVLPRPEHLKGWLTLHWTSAAMSDFLARQGIQPLGSQHPAGPVSDIRGTISRALRVLAEHTGIGSTRFRLRLASAADVGTIGRLVQGLADFEKEPDAVNVTVQEYLRDGFGEGCPPLYYCLLLDDTAQTRHEDGESEPYTCGMALCILEERLHDGGLFLYLEDLFVEEPHRGYGAGKLAMQALAAVALSLQCSKMAWQALHWNTPALTFYGKLGAQVRDGLETLRYTGQTLIELADW